ncbi:MAG: FtsQ-type POTRA domain-containing protein, partial [Polyangiaceae bacterium]|nr:FtsQ-type POTRA domain-containing protein [Polyangiaceae bacterium]
MTPPNRRIAPPRIPSPSLAGDDALDVAPPAAPRRRSVGAAAFAVLRALLGVSVVVGASVAMARAGLRHILTSSRFAITTIVVDGEEHRPSGALVAESGLALGANVFAADLDAARARLLADPWITEAVLSRHLPSTIAIHVAERQAAALVALGDTFLATAGGEPFKRFEPGDPYDLPIITGLRPDDLARDAAGTTRAIRTAIDLAAE